MKNNEGLNDEMKVVSGQKVTKGNKGGGFVLQNGGKISVVGVIILYVAFEAFFSKWVVEAKVYYVCIVNIERT